MIKGIDVSVHNGKLNWEVLKDHIDFAMIRLGYCKSSSIIDDKAAYNMRECDRLGIPYGLYIYSYALNMTGVQKEINLALSVAKKGNPTLGIYFDMEDADGYKKNNGLEAYKNSALFTKFCNTFCDAMRAAGYKAGVYANSDYFNNVLKDRSKFGYIWLASWYNRTVSPSDCPKSYADIWQYSDKGSINGYTFDMNYWVNESLFNQLTKNSKKPSTVKTTTTTKTKYKVGETVKFNKIYKSSNDSSSGFKPQYTSGVITKIYEGAKRPYLIGDGTGFIDDSCIVVLKESSSKTFTKGDKVKVKTGSTWYDGKKIASFIFNSNLYVIGSDTRGILVSTSRGGACTGVIKASNLKHV